MQHYSIRLIKKAIIAHDTFSYFFEKPKGFNFQAGQFVKMTVLEAADAEPKKGCRSMSISSAPSEPHLAFTMRRGISPFKRMLETMPTGKSIIMSEPRGKLTLPESAEKPLIFIAGGVGITPFRSMIMEEKIHGFQHTLFLFYSDKNPKSMCFYGEFKTINHRQFHFIPTFTRIPENEKHLYQETGRINWKMITKYTQKPLDALYYIVGVPQLVIDVKKGLNSSGIDNKNIHFELFTGY